MLGWLQTTKLENEWPTPSPQSLTVLCSSFWPSAMEGTELEELSTSNGTIRELSTSNGTINYTNWRIGKTVDGRISRRMMGCLMIRWNALLYLRYAKMSNSLMPLRWDPRSGDAPMFCFKSCHGKQETLLLFASPVLFFQLLLSMEATYVYIYNMYVNIHIYIYILVI